jgi:hypothetical protein
LKVEKCDVNIYIKSVTKIEKSNLMRLKFEKKFKTLKIKIDVFKKIKNIFNH